MKKHSELSKITIASSIALLAVVFPTAIRAEAPGGESYTPPEQLPADTFTPTPQVDNFNSTPAQGVAETQSDRGSSWGWLGLLGLIGLAGLIPHKRNYSPNGREEVGSDRTNRTRTPF